MIRLQYDKKGNYSNPDQITYFKRLIVLCSTYICMCMCYIYYATIL